MKRREFLASASAAGIGLFARNLRCDPLLPVGSDASFSRLLDSFVTQILREYPETSTYLGLDTGQRADLRSHLDDRSLQGVSRNYEQCLARLSAIDKIDRGSLSEVDRTTYDAVRFAHRLAVDGKRFTYGSNTLRDTMGQTATPYVVSQMTGSFFEVPQFLTGTHPINDAYDVEAYLSRLDEFSYALDAETKRLVADRSGGVVPPSFVLDVVLTQMSGVLDRGASESTLVRSLTQWVEQKALSANAGQRALALVEKKVFPALSRQLAELRVSRAGATEAAGIVGLPDADRYYAWLLQVATTTNLSADEIHRIGEQRSAELESRMDGLLRQLGRAGGSVGERMKALGADSRYLFSDDEKGRAEALAYVRDLVSKARTRLPELFDLKLRADMRVERVPTDIELGAAGAYVVSGSRDGSRPSTYYLNLRTTATWPKWTLPTLTYHEALPGHVWQEALGNEQQPWHPVRALIAFNAYSEGWGLYAEQLADELDFYEGDLVGQLGYLQAQQLRASRLVVDTGLHAKGWSRTKAVERMVQATGRPYEAMRGEVDRYCVKPGQACGYEIGRSEIVGLREKLKQALGTDFNLRKFNDSILSAGNVPISVLTDVVARELNPGLEVSL